MEHLLHVNEGFPVQVPLYADINDLRGNKDETSWDKARLKSPGTYKDAHRRRPLDSSNLG
jgi:hypothetical protein